MCVALTVLLIAVSGHMQELPIADDRPQVASVEPAADPVPMPTATPAAKPASTPRRTESPAPRSPRPEPVPPPTPAPDTLAVAAASAAEPATQASIVGVVKDQQGGTIPGATVRVTSPTSTATHTAVTNPAGAFTVSAVPGEYDVAVSITGFRTSRSRIQVTAGQTTTLSIRLEVGALAESITVATNVAQEGSAAATPRQAPQDPKTVEELLDAAVFYYQQRQLAEAQAMMTRAMALLRPTAAATVATMSSGSGSPETAGPPAPVRVGGSIKEPRKIRDVKPVYPADAAAAGITGIVIIEATIGKDGFVTDAKVLRNVPMLDEAALDAVRQWLFTPTLLNGVPVEVIMTVTVSFGSR